MNIRGRKFILLIFILYSFLSGYAHAKVLGTVGKVYPIAEPDALAEIEERAKMINWKSILDKEKPEDFRPSRLVRLPRSRHERSFLVDMTYTLNFNIPDGKGGILYPKGYTFNPLDYIPFNQTLVILDGEDIDQVTWLKNSSLINHPNTIILLSSGSFSQVSKALGRAIFYADRRIINRFNLRVTPSIVSQKGRHMEVKEIEIPISTTTAH